jgi:hypothetical protein
VVVLVGNVLPLPIDSLFIGILACLIIMLVGLAVSPKKNTL